MPGIRQLAELRNLTRKASAKFVVLSNPAYVHEIDLAETLRVVNQQVLGLSSRHSDVSRKFPLLVADVMAASSLINQLFETKKNQRNDPESWLALRADVNKLIFGMRSKLKGLSKLSSSNPAQLRSLSIAVGEFESLFSIYEIQPQASITDINTSLLQADEIAGGLSATLGSIPEIEFGPSIRNFRKAVSRFRAASFLFDDEINLLVEGANLSEIMEAVNEARATALSILSDLNFKVKERVEKIQLSEIQAAQDRASKALVYSLIAMVIVIILALYLYFSLKDRVDMLVKGTKKIAEGDLTYSFSIRGETDEFDEISIAINSMVSDLNKSFEKLSETQRELQSALDAADTANRLKSTFIANMSHEFRTPLNAIIGFSDLMASRLFGKLGAKQYEGYITDINNSGKHLLELVNGIMDLSKIESGNREFEISEIDLGEALDDTLTLVKQLAREKKIDMKASIDEELPMIFADKTVIHQVLINIINNAVKFTPPKGSIDVKITKTTDNGIRILISDTGIGIPEEDLELIMVPFGQSRTAQTSVVEGTGLGLPIARTLVTEMGGNIEISSKAGNGTEVCICFPPGCLEQR